MNILNLYAKGNLLTLESRLMTTSGSMNYDTCAFRFDSEWKGYNKTAVFAIGDSLCFAVELDETEVCKIPGECLKKTGLLKIGVVGENDDGVVISTNVVVQRVVEGANRDGIQILPDKENSSDSDENNDTPVQETAVNLLWQDVVFGANENIVLGDYSLVEDNDIQSVYNVVFSALAEKYPDYVTANVEGQDLSGNDIMSFAFTGEDYDRVVLITANHFASGYMTIRALGAFFEMLCKDYKTDANLNFLHSKVKFVVIPVVCPEAFFSESRFNSNGQIPFFNYDSNFEESPIQNKGDSPFSEPETIPVISAVDMLSAENCTWFFDFECEDFSQSGKKIFYRANDVTQGNFIRKAVLKFDSSLEENDIYSGSQLVESNAPIATNYATNIYGMNACTVVWSDSNLTAAKTDEATEKFAKFIGSFILDVTKEPIVPSWADLEPVTKHILWKSSSDNKKITLSSLCEPMWLSCYKQNLYGVYNVTLNGFVTVESDYETIVRIKPVLYQKNSPTDDYDNRFVKNNFDVESNVIVGKNVIPFTSVLSCKYSNGLDSSFNTQLVAVIAAACPKPVKVTSFSYTINAVPSDCKNSVEVLSPIGSASDYTSENETPTFNTEYPDMFYDVI